MSHSALQPSFAELPAELVNMIISYFDAPIDPPLCHETDYDSLIDLFCLSHTCQHLRQLTLPKVWQSVEIQTVRQLGAFQELLQAVPSIAPLVKSFRLKWDMGEGCVDGRLVALENVEGSLLQLAFRDRLKLWDDIVKQDGSKVTLAESGRGLLYGEQVCHPPGNYLPFEAWKEIARQGVAAYDWLSSGGGNGPDGNGEDKTIKGPEDFASSINQVVSMLSSLQTFGWETAITPMPRETFDALARLTCLRDFRILYSTCRGNFTDLPFWSLAGTLTALSIDHEEGGEGLLYTMPYDQEEVAEASVDAVEVQTLAEYFEWFDDDDAQAREAVHTATACRTIIAAAMGGQLKRLSPYRYEDYPFKIRALLPCWVRIEDWGVSENDTIGWLGAAAWLRRFLVHASFRRDWLSLVSGSEGGKVTRRLSRQDLVALKPYVRSLDGDDEELNDIDRLFRAVFAYYLPWLVEDTNLAQQVVDAWNTIVEDGEADKVKCPCRSCRQVYRGNY